MYYIVSYDVNQTKCSKIMKILRKYLFHIHNSVFEGELTNNEFILLKKEIEQINLEEGDTIIYYKISSSKALKKEGINIKEYQNIII